ncbi:MAG TPA: 4-(cytidine 5'-diphospho)-2-C-methyl-D-erythritol kinase [Clostridia bacterium]|nr:4-(cytidine 5'-diphospho)-2-C-methyl-D-erythritol kinase [Clostridia bacterium]
MAVLEIPAHAKINLSLDVLGKRPDGYHELRMIMQTVELHDTVRLETTEETAITLKCGSRFVPEDSTNTAWKAAALLMDRYGIKGGVRINIIKRIPVAAGMAGGSADAAAVLRGMNKLFSLGLGGDTLRELGRLVGADVPYCIEGGTRLAEGTGERLTALEDFGGVDILLVKPGIGVSTAWVYGNLKADEIRDEERPDTDTLIQALTERDIDTLAHNMKNVLERVTIPRHGIIREAKERLMELGALGSMMSGSGPTVFGIFRDAGSASEALQKLSADDRWICRQTRTVGRTA